MGLWLNHPHGLARLGMMVALGVVGGPEGEKKEFSRIPWCKIIHGCNTYQGCAKQGSNIHQNFAVLPTVSNSVLVFGLVLVSHWPVSSPPSVLSHMENISYMGDSPGNKEIVVAHTYTRTFESCLFVLRHPCGPSLPWQTRIVS